MALVLLACALAGAAGAWTALPVPVLIAALLWLPGHVACSALARGATAVFAGPARLAPDALLSLALLLLAVLPVVGIGGGIEQVAGALALVHAAVAAASLAAGVRLSRSAQALRGRGLPPSLAEARRRRIEWVAAGVCLALLLPPVLRYAGGRVDDWWDLAFVRAFVQRPELSLHEPILGGGLVHPRFAWNLWLLAQALICKLSGSDPVLFQQTWMPPLTCLLTVSALAALARAVFAPERRGARIGALVFAPLWLYGTEAFPFFARLHQDKFVAALVGAPLMLSALAAFLRKPGTGAGVLLAACAAVTCSIHSILYAFTGAVAALAVACWPAREIGGEGSSLRVRTVALAAVLVWSLYPAWQAWNLSGLFAAQGIALGEPGNPVVRAHLWLDRLWLPSSPFYIVKPSAVFAPVALLALPGLVLAWEGRERSGARLLLAATLLPCAAAFLPGLTALAGRLFVPWMLYRFVWLVPVALLGGSTVATAAGARRGRIWKVAAVAAASVVLTVPVARDRLRRGMSERPFERPAYPASTTLHAYRFLARAPVSGAVMAPAGFSELVAAMTGRPAVAVSERGTLVFSPDEVEAYTRLRDRAAFFASATTPERRRVLARRYGVAYAVFRRTYIPHAAEARLLRRTSAEGFLLRHARAREEVWSASRKSLLGALPPEWKVVYADDDTWIVDCGRNQGVQAGGGRRTGEGEEDGPRRTGEGEEDGGRGRESGGNGERARVAWTVPLRLAEAPVRRAARGAGRATGGVTAGERATSAESLQALAALASYPPGRVELHPAPLAAGNADAAIWTPGAALWDDGPDEVEVLVDLGRDCPVEAVEVVPFLRKNRREAFEIEVDGERLRTRAVDGRAIRLALGPGRRSQVRVRVRSLLGRPFGLDDVRVLGQAAGCTPSASFAGPIGLRRQVNREVTLAQLLELGRRFPHDGRAAIALSRKLADAGALGDAEAVLRDALARDPGLANAWVEFGLLRDRAGDARQAGAAYRRAIQVDSHNAWARGCLAWAQVRAGRPLRALYQAQRAADLDVRYADAFTLRGMAARSLGLRDWAMQSFRRAIRLDPQRDWPYLEVAGSWVAAGHPERARAVLEDYLVLRPTSASVRARLAALEEAAGPAAAKDLR